MTETITEATIPFSNHDHIRTLFGARDRFLRQIRDAIGIAVFLRGDEICLQGSEDQVKRGLEVFAELGEIVEKKGRLEENEVARVLGVGNEDSQPKPATKTTTNPTDAADAFSMGQGSIDLLDATKDVRPRTAGQAAYVKAIRENDLVICTGPAGSGKTYLAVAMAINALRTENVRKIVLVRPAVEAGEKLGFLPGDMLAKVNPFLRPLLDALHDILNFDQVKRYLENDVIEIIPMAFMRGRTLNHTFIILDEGQNSTVTQMKMFLTRMGMGSRIVVTGDITQVDLQPHIGSGLIDARDRLGRIPGVGLIQLTGLDIVRHGLVKEIVRAYEDDARPEARASE